MIVAALEAAKVGNARPWFFLRALRDIVRSRRNCIMRTRMSLCALQRCKNVRFKSITAIARKYQCLRNAAQRALVDRSVETRRRLRNQGGDPM